MKNLLLLLSLFFLSCSSSDDESKNEIPEKFNVKIEIKGAQSPIPRIHLSVNSQPVKKWENTNLPFTSEHTYYTSGDEVVKTSTACNCITINVWAYLSDINEMEEFNFYVDGELVDSTTITDSLYSDGTINPTILTFIYQM